MAPKKAAITVAEAQSTESSPTGESSKPDATAVRKLATHPSTAIMVREAIKELDSRKGVSAQAIQNFIKQKYPSVDLTRLKGLVRRALKKGLESGTLVRPANATASTGATGRFRLAKSNASKAKSENVDPNAQKPSKAEKDGAKEPKKKPADKKEKEPSQEPKPAKKSKKDEPSSKVAPVKKTKAAKTAADEHSEKPKGKAKAVKEDKEKPAKATKAQKEKGKAAQSKAKAAKSDEPPGKAPVKRGKKAQE